MEYQTCKRCNRAEVVDFLVPDDVWAQVSGEYKHMNLCLLCFDELAHEAGVWWSASKMTFVGKSGQAILPATPTDSELVTLLRHELVEMQQENDRLRALVKHD